MIRARALLLLAFAAPINAQVAVSTITPASGNVSGGELVHIHGEHLLGPALPCAAFPTTTCFTFVKFGGVLGSLVTVTNDEIVAVTPPHAAGSVDVEVNIPQNADLTIANGYRYDDPLPSDTMRFLVPVAINTAGAFASSWVSELAVTNENAGPVTIAGATIAGGTTALLTPPSSNTGAFVLVPRSAAANVTMSLHVRDTSRDAEGFGTEIPVVPETQFRPFVVLNGIPSDARFRNLLRIYGYGGLFAHATVTLRDDASGVELKTETVDFSDYAQLPLDTLAGHSRLRAEISATQPASPLVPAPPLWAFVSVTNNDTQQVTTITPSMSAVSASTPLAVGHWAGAGTCVDVTATDVRVSTACAIAQFPRPILSASGQFRAEGTLRITAGPVPIEPPPGTPTLFTGIVNGSDLTLTIVSSSSATVHVQFGSNEPCPQLCL